MSAHGHGLQLRREGALNTSRDFLRSHEPVGNGKILFVFHKYITNSTGTSMRLGLFESATTLPCIATKRTELHFCTGVHRIPRVPDMK